MKLRHFEIFRRALHTLFGWAWMERAVRTERTLKRNGRLPLKYFNTSEPSCFGCCFTHSERGTSSSPGIFTMEGPFGCVPIHSCGNKSMMIWFIHWLSSAHPKLKKQEYDDLIHSRAFILYIDFQGISFGLILNLIVLGIYCTYPYLHWVSTLSMNIEILGYQHSLNLNKFLRKSRFFRCKQFKYFFLLRYILKR